MSADAGPAPTDSTSPEPQQMGFGFAGHMRLTKAQYAYATVRGRMPASFGDWQCKLLAEGLSEAEIKGTPRKKVKELATVTSRWNAITAVQAQIEYERAITTSVVVVFVTIRSTPRLIR